MQLPNDERQYKATMTHDEIVEIFQRHYSKAVAAMEDNREAGFMHAKERWEHESWAIEELARDLRIPLIR